MQLLGERQMLHSYHDNQTLGAATVTNHIPPAPPKTTSPDSAQDMSKGKKLTLPPSSRQKENLTLPPTPQPIPSSELIFYIPKFNSFHENSLFMTLKMVASEAWKKNSTCSPSESEKNSTPTLLGPRKSPFPPNFSDTILEVDLVLVQTKIKNIQR